MRRLCTLFALFAAILSLGCPLAEDPIQPISMELDSAAAARRDGRQDARSQPDQSQAIDAKHTGPGKFFTAFWRTATSSRSRRRKANRKPAVHPRRRRGQRLRADRRVTNSATRRAPACGSRWSRRPRSVRDTAINGWRSSRKRDCRSRPSCDPARHGSRLAIGCAKPSMMCPAIWNSNSVGR